MAEVTTLWTDDVIRALGSQEQLCWDACCRECQSPHFWPTHTAVHSDSSICWHQRCNTSQKFKHGPRSRNRSDLSCQPTYDVILYHSCDSITILLWLCTQERTYLSYSLVPWDDYWLYKKILNISWSQNVFFVHLYGHDTHTHTHTHTYTHTVFTYTCMHAVMQEAVITIDSACGHASTSYGSGILPPYELSCWLS